MPGKTDRSDRRGIAAQDQTGGLPPVWWMSRRWLAVGFIISLVIVVSLAWRARRGGEQPIGVLEAGDFHILALSADDPNIVFFGHHNGLMRSADGGRSWTSLVQRSNFDAMSLAISSAGEQKLYLAGHDIFQTSTDGGTTWQAVAHSLPGTDIHGFAMGPDDSKRLFAHVAGQGLFRSPDEGRTWQPLGGNTPDDLMTLAIGAHPETLYAGSLNSGVLRSVDSGRTWVPMSGLPTPMRGLGSGMALAVADQTIYTSVNNRLYKSTDGGTSWSKLNFPGDNVAIVAVSPLQPNIVLVITLRGQQGLVYRSEDGGQTWQ